MEILKQRILKDGVVKEGNVLKVDKFLNHQMDVKLFNDIGEEFAKRFAGTGVNKILTIESSGIGIACIAAQHFNNCPVIFAKKTLSLVKRTLLWALIRVTRCLSLTIFLLTAVLLWGL